MTSRLPAFVNDLLANPPRAGQGVHHYLFSVARQLHAHLPAVEIVNLLEASVAHCGRVVTRKEIEDAVKNSLSCAWQPGSRPTAAPPARKWPEAARSHHP